MIPGSETVAGNDSIALDTFQSKVGRESAALASGLTQGLVSLAADIYERPLQTVGHAALQIATGVAASALLNKASFLKLPALALAAYGGGEMLLGAKDEIVKASPAVAEIWDDPSVSKQTVDSLAAQIKEDTVATAVGTASFLLANKGFAVLEKSAPNNSFGRLIFGQEPVSLKYPRHLVHASNGQSPELELMPFKQRELDKLVSFRTEDVTYKAYSNDRFGSVAEARRLGARFFTEPSRIYTIAGAKNEVIIPESLDKKIDEVRRLEKSLTFPSVLLNLGKRDAIKAQIAEHPLSQFAKPEDVLTSLAALPDPALAGKITFSHYPIGIFRMNVVRLKDVLTEGPIKPIDARGMAANDGGVPHTYLKHSALRPIGTGDQPDKLLRHEWSHFVEFGKAHYSEVFGAAASFERNGFYARGYATTKNIENQAIHLGEGLLGATNKDFQETALQAPLRSAVMAVRLKEVLAAVPPADRGLFHKLYSDRVDEMEKTTVPIAEKILGYMYTPTELTSTYRKKIMDYLGMKGESTVAD